MAAWDTDSAMIEERKMTWQGQETGRFLHPSVPEAIWIDWKKSPSAASHPIDPTTRSDQVQSMKYLADITNADDYGIELANYVLSHEVNRTEDIRSPLRNSH